MNICASLRKILVVGLGVLVTLGVGCRLGETAGEAQPASAPRPLAQVGKFLRVGPTSAKPVIDGKLDDACWREATMASGFVSVEGEWVEEQTTGYVTYDDTNLYIAFYCNERFPDKVRAATPKDDFQAMIFRDDLVEFFIDTNHDQVTYYHFAVNPAGTRYEAFCDLGAAEPVRENKWNPKWDVETSIDADHWIVEARIPFASLETEPPAPGEEWGFNLNRSRTGVWAGGKIEASSWAMIMGGFNQPEQFGTVVFGDAADVSHSFVSMREYPTHSELRLRLKNAKAEPVLARTEWNVATPWGGSTVQVAETPLAAREEKEISITYDVVGEEVKDVPLEAPGMAELSLAVSNADTGERYDCRKGLVAAPPPLSMNIERYYYAPGVPEMAVKLLRSTKKGEQIEVALRRDMRSDPVAEVRIPLAPGKHEYVTAFDLMALTPGRYVVSAHLLGEDDEKLASIHRTIIKRDLKPTSAIPAGGKAAVNANGIIMLDDKPFCPFLTCATDVTSPLVGEAFNVKYGEIGLMPGALSHPDIGLPWVSHEGAEEFIAMPEEDEMYRDLRAKVLARKSDPSFFCWMVKYEAQIPMYRGKKDRVRVDNVAELKRIREFVKTIAPDQLTSVEVDKPEFIEPYKETADIIEIAMWRSSYGKKLIPHLIEDVDQAQRLVGERQPFLFWIGSSIPTAQDRTAEEIRCAAYLALMHGADGLVFHMGHAGIDPSYTRHWSVYPGLARELEALFPILIAPQPDEPIVRTDADKIDLCVRRYGERLYLIAVNTSPNLVAAEFVIADKAAVLERAKLPLENRAIEMEGSEFSDEFTAFETHVYEFN